MRKVTIKHLLIIIVALLVVIAIPAFKSGYTLAVSTIEGWIHTNKEAYCRNKYPAYVIKAMSESELASLVDDKLKNDVHGEWDSMLQNTHTNPRGRTTREMLMITFSRSLKDREVWPGKYNRDVNRCSQGSDVV